MSGQQQREGVGSEEQQASLLGKLFGGGGGGGKKTVTKAKMGLDMEMYYNEELKCWVMPGEEEEKRQQMGAGGGPPPMSSTLRQQQAVFPASSREAKEHDVPRQRMTRSTSRYAAIPTLRIGQPAHADGLSDGRGSGGILGGLKLPPLSGTGGDVYAFHPASVFKPAMNGSSQPIEESSSDAGLGEMNKQQEGDTVSQDARSIDPIVLEILSFWSYYRSCGYGMDVMKEWVCENYDEDLCLQLDFEQMLKEDGISRAIDEYIQIHRQDNNNNNSKEKAAEIEDQDDGIGSTWHPTLPSQSTGESDDAVLESDDYSTKYRHDNHNVLHSEGQGEAAVQYCQEQPESVQHAYETYSVTHYDGVPKPDEGSSSSDVEEDSNYPGQRHDDGDMEESQAMICNFVAENTELHQPQEGVHPESNTMENRAKPYDDSGMKHIPSAAMDNAEIGCRLDTGESNLVDPVSMSTKADTDNIETIMETDTKQTLKDLEKQLEAAMNTIEGKEDRISELENSLNSLMEKRTSEKAQLEQDLEDAQTEIHTLQAELRGQCAASKEADDALTRSNRRITSLEGEIQDLKSHVQNLEGQCEDMADAEGLVEESKQEIGALKENIDTLSEKNATLAAQVTELLEQIEKLQEERDTMESKMLEGVAALKRAEDEFQTTLDERDAEIMQLEARMTLSEKAAQGAYDKAKEDLRGEVHDLEVLVEDKEAKLQELDEKLLEQERKLLKAKKKIQNQNTQIDELTADCKSLQQQVDDDNHDREAVMMEKSTMEERLRQLEQDLKSYEDIRRQSEVMADELGQKESDVEEMARELSRLRSVEDKLTHWESAASAAQDALFEEKADKDFARAQVAELEQQLSMVTQELNEAKSRVDNIEQVRQSLIEQFEEMQNALQSQREDYSTRLRIAHATIEKSQQDIEDLTALLHKHEACGSSNEDLEAEMASLRHQLASLSGGISQKDEEVRKYKLQLVKAKKLRAFDQERIDELEEMNREYEAKLQESVSRHQLAEDDSLDEALVALGQEEAKVSRLVELLRMAGLTDDEIESELASVELEVGFGGEADDVL